MSEALAKLPLAHGRVVLRGRMRAQQEDFRVEEIVREEMAGRSLFWCPTCQV